jgi:hypothetical protein
MRPRLEQPQSDSDRGFNWGACAGWIRQVKPFAPEQPRLGNEAGTATTVEVGGMKEEGMAEVHVACLASGKGELALMDVWQPLVHVPEEHSLFTRRSEGARHL